MIAWGVIVFIGLLVIFWDLNPVTKAKLMGSPLIIHVIVIGSGLAIHGGSADGAMAAIAGGEKHANRNDAALALADGSLEITEPGDDVRRIVDEVLAVRKRFPSVLVGCDPFGLKAAVVELEGAGVDCVAVPQGWRLSPILDAFERDLIAGRISIAPSQLCRQHFSNAHIVMRGEARSLTKPQGLALGAAKIDACIATLCGYAAMTTLATALVPTIG